MKAIAGNLGRVVAIVMLLVAVRVGARTVILDAGISDRMAGIAKTAPRQSWALHPLGGGSYDNTEVWVAATRSFLIRFPLDQIPAGQRIVHAELLLPVTSITGDEARFYLWRLLAEWGAGVSYLNRSVGAEAYPWTRPGAGGISSDRATRPTDIVRVIDAGDVSVNVTEDLELWYSGAASNEGWLLSVEDPGIVVRFGSPCFDQQQAWRLRITYEPDAVE